MVMKKIIKKIEVEVLTGLHIGAGNDPVEIGGVDSAVIRDPVFSLPYIPGSSLKGKIRCLLETESDVSSEEINKYFGPTSEYLREKKGEKDQDYVQTPTRFIFRDLTLDEPNRERFLSGEITTEFKTEIRIDRKKGIAEEHGLRTIERVPPSVKFKGDILIRYFDDEEKDSLIKILSRGIELLNNDYLGGSGSRGYGAVKVTLED